MIAENTPKMIRTRQRLGKYRIDSRVAEGGFATVFKAFDTVSGMPVALKIPHHHLVSKATLDDFRREVRVTAKLDHPNILPIKDAGFVDGWFVISSPLGEETLADRLQKRLGGQTAMQFAEQMLDAVAFAHRKGVVHCDIKPENFILFPENRLRLADFGIAKVARRTLRGSGAGTVGYIAPEQALGKPSVRSDVFSLGLVLYRMFSGRLPEWPFDWPPPGFDRLKKTLHPDLIDVLRRSLEVHSGRRFQNADRFLAAFRKVKPRALRTTAALRRRKARTGRTHDWRTIRRREFMRRFGRALGARLNCTRCAGPVSEAMRACPWCGVARRTHRGPTTFPAQCPRCRRGVKKDWRFCAWCYGPALSDSDGPRYTDKRYGGHCPGPGCEGPIMPYSRYCPWCRRLLRRKWTIEGASARCKRCGWGTIPEFWDYCPWCARKSHKR